MKFTTSICTFVCTCVAVVSAQFFGNGFGSRDIGLGYNAITGDFGGPSAFGSIGIGPSSIRDPRDNRGPVVFPDPPSDSPIESSGVIPGASGFGFVPPSGQLRQNQFASVRFNNRYFNQFAYL